MSGRYSRYEGDRRSRSPRDRSTDRYDRNSQYGDNDRRRSSAESRGNLSSYNNRDTFRGGDLTREPPRGPKALIDPPSGPRGGGHSGDFRGRGRGRGRGWARDSSRDRVRDRDLDFRDRGWDRDDFRDRRDRSRDRDRDRDWRDNRDNFRGRRASPPGRGRSPLRDFRDRDAGLAVDPDRSRRGSRDGGPPSAGSSNSDQPFGYSPFSRGGFRGRERGRGWDRGGRGRGGGGGDRGGGAGPPYFDDRERGDRFGPGPGPGPGPRSRSQEGRWGPRGDRDDRERGIGGVGGDRADRGDRWNDSDMRRDPRDERDFSRDSRDPRDRELFRAKLEQRTAASQAPSPVAATTTSNTNTNVNTNKDVSPPPLAPSAPAFGSVPSRNTGLSEGPGIGGSGKAPPTGPRGFSGDRPVSAGGSDGTGPPAGPSKPHASDSSPPIPVGPRSQQQKPQRPSSKQWINPNLAGKKGPESPTSARSHSFVSQRRPSLSNAPSDHGDYDRRPRSSDERAGPGRVSPEHLRSLSGPEPGEIESDDEMDHDSKSVPKTFASDTYQEPKDTDMSGTDHHGEPTAPVKKQHKTEPTAAPGKPATETEIHVKERKPLRVPVVHFRLNEPPASAAESDDNTSDEDMGSYFTEEIQKEEAELEKLRGLADDAPDHAIARFASASHDAMVRLVSEPEGLVNILGPVPVDEVKEAEEPAKETTPVSSEQQPAAKPVPSAEELQTSKSPGNSPKPPATEPPSETPNGQGAVPEPSPTEEKKAAEPAPLKEPLPKSEEMEIDGVRTTVPAVSRTPDPAEKADVAEPEDVQMNDAPESPAADTAPAEETKEPAKLSEAPNVAAAPQVLAPATVVMDTVEQSKEVPTPPSPVDDDEDNSTESEEFDPMLVDVVRGSGTPPTESLPDFTCRGWNRDKDFLQTLDRDPVIDDYISKELARIDVMKHAEQKNAREEYAVSYMDYLRFTMSSDPVASKNRDKFIGGQPIDTSPAPPTVPEGKSEGRGAGRRYASERDLERILQESKKEAELRKELEIQAEKDRFRSDKEAIPPDMFWSKKDKDAAQFVDTTGLMPVEDIVTSWNLLPPINNFTQEEADKFEKGYLESIKQWGVIAEGVDNRDFKTCIQYYYVMKKSLNLKEKLKKQPKRRKKGGRAKTRSSALVSELGNAENETEENQESNENGERRRPRRAAAPTWNFEQPPTDSDNATPSGTPGRRAAKGEPGQEKPDGRKGRRRVKDKEPKASKANQKLEAASAPSSGKGRSRSNSRAAQNLDSQTPQPTPPEQRLPTHIEGVPSAPAQQPLLPVQPQPPVLSNKERATSGAPVPAPAEMMAPPALRPEPPQPPQSSMATFDLSQSRPQTPAASQPSTPPVQVERRSNQQPSSYWSVSEAEVFPGLLRSFGSDWHSVAGHMGSKTAVMVKNYYVRQRDSTKPEWEQLVNEADAKKQKGEKRPDPPPAPTQTGRKKYDASGNRPLAAAPREQPAEAATQAKVEGQTSQSGQPQPYGRFAVPIAPQGATPANAQQQLAQAGQQQPPLQIQQHNVPPASGTQSVPPGERSLRASLQPTFGFSEREREREAAQAQQQPVRISQKKSTSESGSSRPLAAAQPPLVEHKYPDQPKLEMQPPKESLRPGERKRLPQEPESAPPRGHYDTFGLHQQQPGRPQPHQESLSPARQPHEQSHGAPPPGQQQQLQQQQQQQPPFTQQPSMRGLLGETPTASTPPSQRPINAAQRQMAGQMPETYPSPSPPQQQASAASPAPTPRPQQERKTSSLMQLLNDDPPAPAPTPAPAAPPKRPTEAAKTPIQPTPTPTPSAMSRHPPPPVGIELRPENTSRGYMYGDGGQAPPPSGMPPLKPSYSASPQTQHMNLPRSNMAGSPHDAAEAMQRDYYRQHQYGQPPPSSGSPQTHGYPAQSQPPTRDPYQGQQGGYAYGHPASHAGSPPPSYAAHQPVPRGREPLPPSREAAWGPSSQGPPPPPPPPQQQQVGGWGPKQGQQPPPQQPAWGSPHGGQKPLTPGPMQQQSSWGPPPPQQPPQQQHPMSMRDERGQPMYGQPAGQHQHQHSISGRYPPPQATRGPEPMSSPAPQHYPPRYATPGPRDPREQQMPPQRSFTPVAPYDSRGPPPPPGPYGPDPRDMQIRPGDPRDLRGDPRDPREMQQQQQQQQPPMIGRQLRPHDQQYERPPDRYR